MDKTPMYKMSLIYVFGVLGLLGRASFVLRFWAMVFCHWRFVPRCFILALLIEMDESVDLFAMS